MDMMNNQTMNDSNSNNHYNTNDNNSNNTNNKSRFEHLTAMITSNWCRRSIGNHEFNKCGYFMKSGATSIIYSFLGWEYPCGDFTLMADLSAEYNILTISDDGQYLLTISNDVLIQKWDLNEMKLVYQWEAHSGAPVSCLDSRSSLLVSGSDNHSIRLWELSRESSTSSMITSSDDTYISDESTTPSSIIHTHRLVNTLKGHSKPVTCVSLNRDHDYPSKLVSCSEDKTLRVWCVSTGQCLTLFRNAHMDKLTSVIFTSGDRVISGSWGNSIKVWNHMRGECSIDINNIGHIPILNINRNCDESFVLTCNIYDTIVWNYPSMTRHFCFTKYESGVACFHPFRPNLMAIHSRYYKRLQLFDLKSKSYILMLKYRTKIITDMLFTPDGLRLIALELNPTSSSVIATVFDLNQ